MPSREAFWTGGSPEHEHRIKHARKPHDHVRLSFSFLCFCRSTSMFTKGERKRRIGKQKEMKFKSEKDWLKGTVCPNPSVIDPFQHTVSHNVLGSHA